MQLQHQWHSRSNEQNVMDITSKLKEQARSATAGGGGEPEI